MPKTIILKGEDAWEIIWAGIRETELGLEEGVEQWVEVDSGAEDEELVIYIHTEEPTPEAPDDIKVTTPARSSSREFNFNE